jgi:D-glycero-D-manno-heptose 1,7-bisphosphate phosphatase
MSTIFLDRDGVINENRSDYIKSWSEFRFIPGSKEAIARLTMAGHHIIICTNQAVVSKSIITVDTVEDIHRHMVMEISKAGGIVDQVYYCPHSKEARCSCRKPQPGMLFRARDDLGVDLHDAIFVGDNISDVQAGLAAGVHPILVLTGLGMQHLNEAYHRIREPFHIARSLQHTASFILQGWHMRELDRVRFLPSATICKETTNESESLSKLKR